MSSCTATPPIHKLEKKSPTAPAQNLAVQLLLAHSAKYHNHGLTEKNLIKKNVLIYGSYIII